MSDVIGGTAFSFLAAIRISVLASDDETLVGFVSPKACGHSFSSPYVLSAPSWELGFSPQSN